MKYPFQFNNSDLNREYSKILELENFPMYKGKMSDTEFVITINYKPYGYSSITERDEDYDLIIKLHEERLSTQLRNKLRTNPDDVSIYATGCSLTPTQLKNGKWGWVVNQFEEDSYYKGEEVNVNHTWSNNPEDLCHKEEE
jgi:hypothetical protein